MSRGLLCKVFERVILVQMASAASAESVGGGEFQIVKQAISQRLYDINDCHDIKFLIFRSIKSKRELIY